MKAENVMKSAYEKYKAPLKRFVLDHARNKHVLGDTAIFSFKRFASERAVAYFTD